MLDRVPPGFLVDAPWLAKNDITTSSVHDYLRSNWLERIARGLYRRPYATHDPHDENGWKIPILSAQWIMGYDFHVGAATALALLGYRHYLTLGSEPPVYLYGDIPVWLPRLPLSAMILPRQRQLFGGKPIYVDNLEFDPFAEDGSSPWRWPLKVSSPERAILEALKEVPGNESFEALDKLFESLVSLRPKRLDQLLRECRSVKVKRLFFLFADRHSHAWLRHLDKAAIDLGSGPRKLVEGGKLNSAYQLVVPPEFARGALHRGA